MSAAEIIHALGRDRAAALSKALGGKFVYIPQEASPDNAIAEAIGEDALADLIRALGSGALYIPTSIWKRERDTRIQELGAKGYSARQIARALGLSDRTVRHIRRFDRITEQLKRPLTYEQRRNHALATR